LKETKTIIKKSKWAGKAAKKATLAETHVKASLRANAKAAKELKVHYLASICTEIASLRASIGCLKEKLLRFMNLAMAYNKCHKEMYWN
jgi:hypothetical protein